MCAGSKSKIGNDEVKIYMGYLGGEIIVGNIKYTECEKDKTKIETKLNSYKKSDLVKLIIDLIDNSEEY